MKVQLLYVEGCPNVELARKRVGEAANRAGIEIRLREREVSDEAEAIKLGMRGSPTILIDGEDALVGGEGAGSMSCRLYDNDTGDGAPTVDELVAALTR